MLFSKCHDVKCMNLDWNKTVIEFLCPDLKHDSALQPEVSFSFLGLKEKNSQDLPSSKYMAHHASQFLIVSCV